MKALIVILLACESWWTDYTPPAKPDPPAVRIIDTVRQTVLINGRKTTRIIKRYRDTGEVIAQPVKKKVRPVFRIPIFPLRDCPT